MSIQINEDFFLPKIKEFAQKNKPVYQDNSVDLGRTVLSVAQGWFDDQPWTRSKKEYYDTQRECRIELKRYILNNIDLRDERKSFFVPTFVWIWIAQTIITYIVKMIIEHYWTDLSAEIGLDI